MRAVRCSSRWAVMAWQLAVALFVLTLSRLVYYGFNQAFFDFVTPGRLGVLLLAGVRFDLGVIGWGCAGYFALMLLGAWLPPEVVRRRGWRVARDLLFLLPMAVMVLANVADAGYYPYVLTRASANIFVEFEGEDMGGLAGSFIVRFWPLTVAYVVLAALLVIGYFAIRHKPSQKRERGRLLGTIATTILLAPMMRIPPGLADRYIDDYRETALVLNTPYTLTRSGSAHIRRQQFFASPEELRSHFEPTYRVEPLSDGDSLFGCLRGRNVVVILMESMAREYVGALNAELKEFESRTPFLDSLLSQSLYAKYGFATGKRSVEAFPALFASIPSFGIAFNDKHFRAGGRRSSTGLPTVLREEGYRQCFYHGDEPGAMGFFTFLRRMGVEEQYTAREFRRDVPEAERYFMPMWGVFDGPFEQAMAADLEEREQPFAAYLFSLTNHDPYVTPEGYVPQEGSLPIHKTAHYADDALRAFFDRIRGKPWYEETVFVLTGDHTNLSDRPEYDSAAGRSMVPILIYAPGIGLKGEISDRVVQHTDIYPTLLYLLGIEREIRAYGSNMLDDGADHFALNYFFDRYFLFTKELTVAMSPEGKVEITPPSYPVQSDRKGSPDEATAQHYADLLRAIVQDYNDRLLEGEFVLSD